MYKYNSGKFRLMYGTNVYYMLFGIIPIKLFNIEGSSKSKKGKMFTDKLGNPGTLAIFKQISNKNLKIDKLL